MPSTAGWWEDLRINLLPSEHCEDGLPPTLPLVSRAAEGACLVSRVLFCFGGLLLRPFSRRVYEQARLKHNMSEAECFSWDW